MWPSLPAGQFRHAGHRFEWTREEFQNWCEGMCSEHGYSVDFHPIGPVDDNVGSPTQMAVFRQKANPVAVDDRLAQAESEAS